MLLRQRRKKTAPAASSSAPSSSSEPSHSDLLSKSSFEFGILSHSAFSFPFLLLLAARLASALFNVIGDCDETFNYWEPLHFIVYGHGMQTWEYAPRFGLRSYAYLLPLASLAELLRLIALPKPWIFYCLRAALALCSATTDFLLFDAVRSHFGRRVSWLFLSFLTCSAGLFYSTSALLPTSTSQMVLNLSLALFLYSQNTATGRSLRLHRHDFAIASLLSLSFFAAWPFAALASSPIIIVIVWRRGVISSTLLAFRAVLCTALPVFFIDSLFYSRPVLATANIIAYNVFGIRLADADDSLSPVGSSELYGVEPSKLYYVRSLLVSFGPLLLCLALLSLPLAALQFVCNRRESSQQSSASPVSSFRSGCWLVTSSCFSLWLVFMSLQPHKEERFMFVIHGLLCLNAALAWSSLLRNRRTDGEIRRYFVISLDAVLVLSSVLFGLSRALFLVNAYGAPIHAADQFHRHLAPLADHHDHSFVCYGKEWYRFPSSFFIPNSARLRFVDAGFDGQMPRPFFEESAPTHSYPPFSWVRRGASLLTGDDFNDLNQPHPRPHEEFLNITQCTLFVDLEASTGHAPASFHANEWELVFSTPFFNRNRHDNAQDLARISTLRRLLLRVGKVLWLPPSDLRPLRENYEIWKRKD